MATAWVAPSGSAQGPRPIEPHCCKRTKANWQSPIGNCELRTANCQLRTISQQISQQISLGANRVQGLGIRV